MSEDMFGYITKCDARPQIRGTKDLSEAQEQERMEYSLGAGCGEAQKPMSS